MASSQSIVRSAGGRLRGLFLLGALFALPEPGSAQTMVDNCSEAMFLDRTAPAADRAIFWDFSTGTDPERCMTIRAGQSVTWFNDAVSDVFFHHPLESNEGDTPNPISNHVNGVVTFTQPGTFGYRCTFHLAMRGAIKVLPAVSAAAVPALGNHLPVLGLALLAVTTWITRRRTASTR